MLQIIFLLSIAVKKNLEYLLQLSECHVFHIIYRYNYKKYEE